MADDVAIRQFRLKLLAPRLEFRNLRVGEIIHLGIFTASQMGEYRLHTQHIVFSREAFGQFSDVRLSETQTMHSGVKLHMHGIRGSTESTHRS